MSIKTKNFERCVRPVRLVTLSATLSAALLAACGGGDPEVEEPTANTVPTARVERASAQASRKPSGGADVPPIYYCLDASPTCTSLPPAK